MPSELLALLTTHHATVQADPSVSNTTPMRESNRTTLSPPDLCFSSPNAIERNFNTTIKNLGTPYAGDLTCGNPAGLAPIANTRSGNTRIDACQYLTPDFTARTSADIAQTEDTCSTGTFPT